MGCLRGVNISMVRDSLSCKQRKSKEIEICADPFHSQANMKRLRASIEQMEKTGGTIREIELD